MTGGLHSFDDSDHRLAAVRVDANGNVVFEDARRGVRRRLDPESAMHAIIEAAAGGLPERREDIISDWIDKGWRPSLEYILWSELSSERTIKNDTPAACADDAPREWHRLPDPTSCPPALTVGELLIGRRTVRVFDPRPLTVADLASVVALSGIDLGTGVSLRLVVYNVTGLVPGVWTVDQQRRSVRLDAPGNFREEMSALMCGMPAARTASLTFVLVVDMLDRQRAYPYERALRELYVDLGRNSQHLIIAAEALGLGCLITPATNDRKLMALLDLKHQKYPAYTITIGHKSPLRS